MLCLGRVAFQITFLGVLSEDHPRVHVDPRPDEERATGFKVLERVLSRLASGHGDEHPLAEVVDRATVGPVPAEEARQDASAPRVCEEDGAVSEQAAGGCGEADASAARFIARLHVHQLSLAVGKLVDDDTGVVVVHLHQHLLHRLLPLSVLHPVHHLWRRNLELEALATHVLDQDAQLQLPAPVHLERLPRPLALRHLDADVGLGLLHEALPDHGGAELGALFAVQRRVVRAERHAHGGRVDGDRRDGLRHLGIAHCVGHRRCREPCQLDDVAGHRLIQRQRALLPGAVQDLGDLACLDLLALHVQHLHRVADLAPPRDHAASEQPAQEDVVAEHGHTHRKRLLIVARRRGNVFDDGVEQRDHVLARPFDARVSPPVAARRVDDGEVKLRLVRIEVCEQVKHLARHLVDTACLFVDLVDHHNRSDSLLQGLGKHKLGLSHRALLSVNQKEYTVDHRHHPLDFSSKIRMAWCVHQVQLRSFPHHARHLCHDRDATLLLQVERIHASL
mmetsp:Transcript_13946/g.32817  ORF Transcript_13946/g.32817 Transcript_13946/m.32817 type:complete len:507 (+) Transcript_13946:329-1849(+)